MSSVYQQLIALLSRYMSGVNAHSVVGRAVRHAVLSPEQLSSRDIETLMPTLDRGIRLFVEAILEARARPMSGTPQPAVKGRHYGQPTGADLLRLWLRILARRFGARST